MNTNAIPVVQYRRPYVGPMHRALDLAPWVTTGAIALLFGVLNVAGSRLEQQPLKSDRKDTDVRHVTLAPVEVVGHREAVLGPLAANKRASAEPGSAEPATLAP